MRASGDGATIGIYAYSSDITDTFGGVESHVGHFARILAKAGFRVVLHCLSASTPSLVLTEQGPKFAGREAEPIPNIITYYPLHGPGHEGSVQENLEVSIRHGEQEIYCFGTRDGYVFDIAIDASQKMNIPLTSFIYFTIEERWFRSYFKSRTRSIAGLASVQERQDTFEAGGDTVIKVVKASCRVIVPTHYVRAQILAISGIEATPKVEVCYHGVDPDLFCPALDQNWSPGRNMLTIARLSVPFAAHKGFLWAASFFAERNARLPVRNLIFCGQGNGQKTLQDYAESMGISDRMIVAGFVAQSELVALYRDASFLLTPSMMEAGSTTVVEAVLCNCLPVALDVAGLSEVMCSLGLSAYCAPARSVELAEGVETFVPDSNAIQTILLRAAENPDTVRADLERAREIALDRFSIAQTTDRLMSLISRGLSF